MEREVGLSPAQRAFLAAARRAVLATVDPGGRPRLVPICHALATAEEAGGDRPVVWTPLDDKPKATDDPRRLARVTDLLDRPDVTLLVDRWSEDWQQLGWLRAHGRARLLEPDAGAEHEAAVWALRAKYPQYALHRLEARPVIRIAVERVRSWGQLELDL